VDLSSAGPLVALGKRGAIEVVRSAQPDLLFAAGIEARALATSDEALLDIAPIVVLKRGAEGATLLYREESKRAGSSCGPSGRSVRYDGRRGRLRRRLILGWLAARRDGASTAAGLRRGAVAGHRFARRQLLRPREELAFG